MKARDSRGSMTIGMLGALALLVWTAAPALAQPLSLDAIMRDPVKFDRRPVTVTGTVGLVEGSAGRPQTAVPSQTFTLVGSGVSMRVIGPAQPTVRVGDRVEVEGIFSFAGNQIEAYRVTWR